MKEPSDLTKALEVILKILTSPTLLRRVAKTLDLEHNRSFLDGPVDNRSTLQSLLGVLGFKNAKQPAKDTSLVLPDTTAPMLSSMTSAVDEPAEIERLTP